MISLTVQEVVPEVGLSVPDADAPVALTVEETVQEIALTVSETQVVRAEWYDHSQAVAATTWTVAHNLGFRPTVTLLTTGGVEFVGEVVHESVNLLRVYLSSALAGTARCH